MRKHTKTLDRSSLFLDIEKTVSLCHNHRIDKIELLFGFSWGNAYRSWQPVVCSPDGMETEIKTAESKTKEILGLNDLFLDIQSAKIKLQYCHHGDIHMEYQDENSFVLDYLKWWRTNDWELTDSNMGSPSCEQTKSHIR